MRQLFFLLVVIHELFTPARSINGVMWDKNSKDFVPILSVPTFAALNQEILNRSRAAEVHNFQGRIVKLSYYEIKNILIEGNNGTSVTGFIGEMWNTLADFLNFTLKPEVSVEKTIGSSLTGKFEHGLLRLIYHNETDIIARLEATNGRRAVAQFTYPLITTRYRFYIRPNVIHYRTWMLKLFSKKSWFAILAIYILFSFCSYLTQSIDFETQKKSILPIKDYFFYNFGVMCSQTYYPNCGSESAKMVEYVLGMFSLLINTAFNALVISYMSQTFVLPPFQDIDTILETSYHIYTVNGSIMDIAYKANYTSYAGKAVEMKRYHTTYSVEQLYNILCSSKQLTTGLLSVEIKKASGMYNCRLNPVGDSVYHANIVSGVSKHFEHKRSIDIGLLRLYEHGIGPRLRQRWVESQNQEDKSNAPQAIVLEQVYLVVFIFYSGLLLSITFLILENLIFYCNKRRLI